MDRSSSSSSWCASNVCFRARTTHRCKCQRFCTSANKNGFISKPYNELLCSNYIRASASYELFFISCLYFASWWFSAFIFVQFFIFIVYSFVFTSHILVFRFAIILWVCLFCRCRRTSTDDALVLCSCAKWFNLGANSLTNRCAKKTMHTQTLVETQKYQMGDMKVWQK